MGLATGLLEGLETLERLHVAGGALEALARRLVEAGVEVVQRQDDLGLELVGQAHPAIAGGDPQAELELAGVDAGEAQELGGGGAVGRIPGAVLDAAGDLAEQVGLDRETAAGADMEVVDDVPALEQRDAAGQQQR